MQRKNDFLSKELLEKNEKLNEIERKDWYNKAQDYLVSYSILALAVIFWLFLIFIVLTFGDLQRMEDEDMHVYRLYANFLDKRISYQHTASTSRNFH